LGINPFPDKFALNGAYPRFVSARFVLLINGIFPNRQIAEVSNLQFVNWLTYIQLGFNIALVGITPRSSPCRRIRPCDPNPSLTH